jgi:hypothetical protein
MDKNQCDERKAWKKEKPGENATSSWRQEVG